MNKTLEKCTYAWRGDNGTLYGLLTERLGMAKDSESKRLEATERNKRDVADAQSESDDAHVRDAADKTKQEAEGIRSERDHHEGRTK